jgi:hypothetical protein
VKLICLVGGARICLRGRGQVLRAVDIVGEPDCPEADARGNGEEWIYCTRVLRSCIGVVCGYIVPNNSS